MRFSLLGGAVIEGPAARVDVRGAQPALVLADLLLERPRPMLRHELVELLWPGELPAHWEGAARQVVSRVRRELVAAGLAPESLSSEGGVTRLDLGDAVEVDVEVALGRVNEAERLVGAGEWERAAALAEHATEALRRPFLGSCEGSWVDGWRDRLDAAERRGLRIGAAAALGAERGGHAAQLAGAALGRDPLDEEATRLVMAACEQSGNRAGALRAYERLRRLLDDELGVRPAEETEDFHRRLLGAAPEPPVGARVGLRSPATVDAGVFVGRDDEMAALERAWKRTGDGGCQVVVLEGEAGIGKSRLIVEEASRVRAQGAAVLWARCEPDVGIAHGPFADLIGQVVTSRPDVVARLGSLAGHLAPVVPDLVGETGEASPESPDQATTRLFRAVGAALAAAADRPLLVVIDDLHWAGGDTLGLLRHVVPLLSERPCVVVLALREAPPAVAGALAELHRLAPTATVTLRGLSVDDITRLLHASRLDLPDEAGTIAEVVAARTAGNPLYVTELVREAEASELPFDPTAVPGAVAQFLERRLGALDDDLVSVLVLSAVAGPTFDLATIEACTAASPDELLDLVEDLCRRHFLEEQAPGRFGFGHELVRDAVLATVGATRRTRLHRRVADVLATAGAAPDAVAHHYVAAGPVCLDEAVTWSLAAGRATLASAAWTTAHDHFATAARLGAATGLRCQALIGLGQARRALGAAPEARATLEEALALARIHGLAREVASATLALVGGGGRGVAVDLLDAERARLLRDARAGLGSNDVDLLVPVLAELALALVLTDAADERRALSEECLAAARRWGDPDGLATALLARRIASMGPSGTEARAVDAREALALPRAEVAPESVLGAQLGLVEDLLELGDRAGADESLEVATRLAADLDHPYWSWATACWRTLSAVIDGRCDDAEELAFAAVEHQTDEHPEALAALGVNLVDIRLFQGRAGEMLDLLRAAVDDNPSVPAYRAVLALCCAEVGELHDARQAYDFFARQDFALPADTNWLLATAVLADTCVTLGDGEGAVRLAALLEPWADRQVILNCYGGGGAYWGTVAHHLGRLAALRGDGARAGRLLARAADLADDFRAPLFAARSRAALAALG